MWLDAAKCFEINTYVSAESPWLAFKEPEAATAK